MIKKLLLILSVLVSLPAHSGDSNNAIAYLTAWGLTNNAAEVLAHADVDTYFLAFAKWNENALISTSNGLLEAPDDLTSEPSLAYSTWTQLAFEQPSKEFLISFGGQEFEAIWDQLKHDNVERIASAIANLLVTSYPVFQESESGERTVVGHAQLDGVDFDFEQSKRLTEAQNELVLKLAMLVRKEVNQSKRIVLTTYHVGADNPDCIDDLVLKGCSFTEIPRSSHHGEVLPILKSSVGVFDYYNVMTYDAGRGFDYQTAMANYHQVVGNRALINLGVTINRQWGPDGGFVMPVAENNHRVSWQQQQGFGGFFVWALGKSSEARNLDSQVSLFNEFARLNRGKTSD
jgi:chitinase